MHTERELFEHYLLESKKTIDTEIRNLQGQLKTELELKSLGVGVRIPADSATKTDANNFNFSTENINIEKQGEYTIDQNQSRNRATEKAVIASGR